MLGLRDSNYYTREFKLKVVGEVLSGQISKEEARRLYGIQGKSTVLKWIRKSLEEDTHMASNVYLVQDYPKELMPDKHEIPQLLKRIKELERQLEDEKVRSKLYSTIIDIAEKEYKIPVRKKHVTKQSK